MLVHALEEGAAVVSGRCLGHVGGCSLLVDAQGVLEDRVVVIKLRPPLRGAHGRGESRRTHDGRWWDRDGACLLHGQVVLRAEEVAGGR